MAPGHPAPWRRFQSSPGPRGPGVRRRREAQNRVGDVSILARPSRAGRPRGAYKGIHSPPVSILARPSRAGRPGTRPSRACCSSVFQSSPGPRGPGVLHGAHDPVPNHRVSILARPSRAGRPKHGLPLMREHQVSILARPSRAGRPMAGVWISHLYQVSILARPSRAGRPSPLMMTRHRMSRFTPPPALAGRASP